jgi:hypothetical protein
MGDADHALIPDIRKQDRRNTIFRALPRQPNRTGLLPQAPDGGSAGGATRQDHLSAIDSRIQM